MFSCAPWRSTHGVRSILTLCTAGAAVLKSPPVLASDPAGLISGLYMFLLLVPWLALNLVLTVVIAIRGATGLPPRRNYTRPLARPFHCLGSA